MSQSWLRLRSGSLWPCVLQHALLNVLIYHVFEPLTRPAPGDGFFSGDSNGAGTLIGLGLAAAFWRRRAEPCAAAPGSPALLSLPEPSPATRATAPRGG